MMGIVMHPVPEDGGDRTSHEQLWDGVRLCDEHREEDQHGSPMVMTRLSGGYPGLMDSYPPGLVGLHRDTIESVAAWRTHRSVFQGVWRIILIHSWIRILLDRFVIARWLRRCRHQYNKANQSSKQHSEERCEWVNHDAPIRFTDTNIITIDAMVSTLNTAVTHVGHVARYVWTRSIKFSWSTCVAMLVLPST